MKASIREVKCFRCGKKVHIKFQCSEKSEYQSKWCHICKSKTHFTKDCRKRNYAKVANAEVSRNCTNDDSHSFAMGINVGNDIRSDECFNTLLVDCGATAHIVCDKNKFIRFDESFDTSMHYIELADGSRTNNLVYGKGDASVTLADREGNIHKVLLKDALCVPSYKQDIFSVQAASKYGISVSFSTEDNLLYAPNGSVFDICQVGKLYYLNNVRNYENVSKRTLQQWHQVMGHCNVKDILKLQNVTNDMEITEQSDLNCDICIKGKMAQYRNRAPDQKALKIFDLVHCDLAGPIDPIGKDGFKYAICFVDDFSGAIFVYLLKNKCDSVVAAEKFLSDVSPYGKVKCLRTDNGTEFSSKVFGGLLRKNLIKHEFSAPYSPHQNGTAERAWRTIFEMTRCLLLEARLPKYLWTYAVKTAAYIRNRCYNSRLNCTPYEAITSNKPSLRHMQIFGSKCFAYVQDKKKLDDRSEEGVFIGYDNSSPSYFVYFPHTNNVRKVRCVKFDVCKPVLSQQPEYLSDNEVVSLPLNEVSYPLSPSKNSSLNEKSVTEEDVKCKRPVRNKKKPLYLSDYITDDDLEMSNISKCSIDHCYALKYVPCDYKDALSSPESEKWCKAMKEEMLALNDNNTYSVTDLPKGKNLVGSKWVYSVKLGSNNEEKFKARLVAKGFSQVENIDYHETFSPTAKMATVRMLMQLAVQNNFVVHQMDVKSAYLNADIHEDIYLQPAEGFEEFNNLGEKLVWKLNKSLYGLKQSGRNWNNMLSSFLITENFEQSMADPCLYSKSVEGACVILIVWVDDIVIASDDSILLNAVKMSLSFKFKMKDLGILSWFLGMEFNFQKSCISMSQHKYIEKLLSKFKMSDCAPKIIPCDPSVNKMMSEESAVLTNTKLFKEIVGSLIYVMTCTRPDLSFVVTKLSQFMSNPRKCHFDLAKYVLRYLKSTIHYSLKFSKIKDGLKLNGYSDSDWGGDVEDRKSISGYGFQFGDRGPLISWKSKKQNLVALSSCEAEYIAITVAVQEAKFLGQLLSDMTSNKRDPVILFADNQGAIELSKNPVHHQRTKHIDIKFHFIRSEIQNGFIVLVYVNTNENLADIFTKPVTKPKLGRFKFIFGDS